jgi:hypothetical protein
MRKLIERPLYLGQPHRQQLSIFILAASGGRNSKSLGVRRLGAAFTVANPALIYDL